MTCEVCGVETSKEHSDEPVDGEYFVYVSEDPDNPEGAINKQEFEFCSLGHLVVFHPDGNELLANEI